MKQFISAILTVFITAACLLYTYSSYDLPFRKRAFTVTLSDGSVTSLHELIKTENKYRDTPVNVSADFYSKDVTISGEIVIDKIEQDGEYIKVYSDYPYFDFGKAPLILRPSDYENVNAGCRYFVVYFAADNINLYDFPVREKIKFKSKFNNINAKYIVCTEGEVL